LSRMTRADIDAVNEADVSALFNDMALLLRFSR